jgi:hypothetical protein
MSMERCADWYFWPDGLCNLFGVESVCELQSEQEVRMASLIGMFGMVVGTVGIFFGFYYLAEAPQTSLGIVTITTVGIVGILAFVRHVIFHKSDAERLGWQTSRPDWMFEVGFANLAFGFMAFLAVFVEWGTQAQAVVLLGYSLYLFQAAALHGYRYFTDERRSPARLWRSVLATLLFSGMMTFFAVRSLLGV